MALLIFGIFLTFAAATACLWLKLGASNVQHRSPLAGAQVLLWLALIAACVLVVVGFGQTRENPVFLWAPPSSLFPLILILTAAGFVALAAALFPRNGIALFLRHPVLIALLLWALAHLLGSGRLASIVLFFTTFVWSAWALWFSWRRSYKPFARKPLVQTKALKTHANPDASRPLSGTVGAMGNVGFSVTPKTPAKPTKLKTVLTMAFAIVAGLILWFAFVVQLHTRLVGVPLII